MFGEENPRLDPNVVSPHNLQQALEGGYASPMSSIPDLSGIPQYMLESLGLLKGVQSMTQDGQIHTVYTAGVKKEDPLPL